MDGSELQLKSEIETLSGSEMDHSMSSVSPQTSSSEGPQDSHLNPNSGGSLPPLSVDHTIDQQEVVIMVVGNEEQDKIGETVADTLPQRDASESRRTVGGVRIRPCTSPAAHACVVVDTTPLRNVEGKSPTAIARQWISQNSLRRLLFGRLLSVVCVIRWSGLLKEKCFGSVFNCDNCWVDLFGLIFENHKDAILILVNTEGNDVDETMKSRVDHFLMEHKFMRRNITYADLTGGDESVRAAVEETVSLSKIAKNLDLSSHSGKHSVSGERHRALGCLHTIGRILRHPTNLPTCTNSNPATNPAPYFDMEEVSSGFGPWGPERAIVFGKTGCGKSTLAQMLTLGHLDADSKAFTTSSGARGATEKVQTGVGRGWHVVDTPGFGEPPKDGSTITTREAQIKVKKYIKKLEGTYSHYLYVWKREKMDDLESRIWKFFLELFGEKISYHFSVVVSGDRANKAWLNKNIEDLRKFFKGCNSFVCAEFPSLQAGIEDVEWENELRDVRENSLRELEEDLAKLGRSDISCKRGQNSKMHHKIEKQRARLDASLQKDGRIKTLLGEANIYSTVADKISTLTNILIDENNLGVLPEIKSLSS